jgi:hypothetical protein
MTIKEDGKKTKGVRIIFLSKIISGSLGWLDKIGNKKVEINKNKKPIKQERPINNEERAFIASLKSIKINSASKNQNKLTNKLFLMFFLKLKRKDPNTLVSFLMYQSRTTPYIATVAGNAVTIGIQQNNHNKFRRTILDIRTRKV